MGLASSLEHHSPSNRAGSADIFASELDHAVIALPGGNRYDTASQAYCTDHLPPQLRRDLPLYWELQHKNVNGFQKDPRRRENVTDTLRNFASATGRRMRVAILSSGTGREVSDIAQAPWVRQVHAVDFSSRVRASFDHPSRGQNSTFYHCTNQTYLEGMKEWGEEVDMVLAHGGLFENMPDVSDAQNILHLATEILAPGGILWTVGLVQPALNGALYNDQTSIDVPGMYCHAIGCIIKTPGMRERAVHQVAQSLRVRRHMHEHQSLQGTSDSILHGHTIERAAWIKEGLSRKTIEKYSNISLIGAHLS